MLLIARRGDCLVRRSYYLSPLREQLRKAGSSCKSRYNSNRGRIIIFTWVMYVGSHVGLGLGSDQNITHLNLT